MSDFPTQEQLEEQFATASTEATETPIPAAHPAPPEEPGPDAPVPSEEAGTPDDVAQAMAFLDWTKRNPDGWEQLLAWERGENVIVPRTYLDQPQRTQAQALEDEPTDYYSEDYLKGLRRGLDDLSRKFDQRVQLEAKAAVDEGVSRFRKSHEDLEAKDLAQVMQFVYERGLLNSIPEDLSSPAKSSAVEQRFEEAYRSVFYDRTHQEAARQVVNDLSARRRAASSSSQAASTPRVEPAPSTPEEKRAAYVDAFAQALAEDGGS